MNIIIKEILANQRLLGKVTGTLEGIVASNICPTNSMMKTIIEWLKDFEFSEEFWEAIADHINESEK